jgi:hypothetical protein
MSDEQTPEERAARMTKLNVIDDNDELSSLAKRSEIPSKDRINTEGSIEKGNIPPSPTLNASTSFLDDLMLYLRNRLKQKASTEGDGIDSGGIGIGKVLGIGGFLVTNWPLIVGLIVILGVLFATGILKF